MIPLFVSQLLAGKKVPLYGDGSQERDWLHVDDHAAAIDFVAQRGQPGQIYNIAGRHTLTNKQLTLKMLNHLGKPQSLIEHVRDRIGHDRRYALDDTKLRRLGWSPQQHFDKVFGQVLDWYKDHQTWLDGIRQRSADYQRYFQTQYEKR